MQQTLQKLFTASLLTFGCISVQAQTVSTFDDVTLAGIDTTFLETKYPVNGVYTFESGNATFYGNVSWNTLWGNFNCSNGTDTMNTAYDATAASITGSGFGSSANYGIAFVPTDFMGPVPSATIPVGLKLNNAAVGKHVAGVYYSNAVFTYRYIADTANHFAANHFYMKLLMRGYLNGVKSADSVMVTLADFTDTNTVLVNKWKWANLTALGNVDSVTFDLVSNDTAGGFGINTPSYFAIDNFTTLDGVCPKAINIAATSLNENSATLSWISNVGNGNFSTNYEAAVDQSASLAPGGTAILVTNNTYSKSGLTPNTTYFVHVRAACPDGGYSDWDTASFKTLPATGLSDINSHLSGITLSPNPAKDFVNLQTAIPVNASIYNFEGRLMLRTNNATQIDIRSLAAGSYVIHISNAKDASQQTTLRFIKN